MTILMHSCRSGSLDLVQWLVDSGHSDPHHRDAVRAWCGVLVTCLCALQSCIVMFQGGWTAVMSAASDGHMHIVQWLHATHKVDLTLQDVVRLFDDLNVWWSWQALMSLFCIVER
jgi:TRAP-type C4-dicarboxylate transport system permease small subunit